MKQVCGISALFLALAGAAPLHAQCDQEVELETLDAGAPGPTLWTPDGAPLIGGAFSLQLKAGPPSATGVLGLGIVEAPQFLPLYGATLYPQVAALVPFALDGAGASPKLAGMSLLPPAFCGLPLVAQAAVQDAAAPGGVALSNALRMRAGVVLGPVLPSAAFAAGSLVECVVAADFDGDGIDDLATANGGTHDLSILLGEGDGTFTPGVAVPLSVHPLALASGDLDGDGDQDLAAVTQGHHDVPFDGATHIVLGNGDGTFAAPLLIDQGWVPTGIAAADLDLDGSLDLAVTDGGLGDFAVSLNLGGGTFQPAVHYPLGAVVWSVAAADFNLDGQPDLAATLDLPASTDFVVVAAGIGGGAFAFSQLLPGLDGPRGLATADLDASGTPDLFVTQYPDGDAFTYLGTSGGGFAPPIASDAGPNAQSPMLADLDGDGLQDFAAANRSLDTVTMGLGTGTGAFVPGQTFYTGGDASTVAGGDFDGDGALDLAVSCRVSQRVEVLLRAGLDPNASRRQIDDGPAAGVQTDLVLQDMDGDGVLDIVSSAKDPVPLPDGAGLVAVLAGSGDGTFGPPSSMLTGAVYTAALAVGDLNGDGLPDACTANGSYLSVSVLLGGPGGLAPPQQTFFNAKPLDVALADLDGDGDLDVVTVNGYQDSASVLKGDGFGGLVLDSTFATEPTAWSVATTDLNQDSIVDVLVGSLPNHNVGVFPGPVFGQYQAFPTPGGVWSLAADDLNGDGDPDVAVAVIASPSVGVLLGAAGVTLLPAASYAPGDMADLVAIDDVTGDGRLDVVAGDPFLDKVLILPGDGAGTFGSAVHHGGGKALVGLATGDLDGDGLSDVVTAHQFGYSVLLNRIGE